MMEYNYVLTEPDIEGVISETNSLQDTGDLSTLSESKSVEDFRTSSVDAASGKVNERNNVSEHIDNNGINGGMYEHDRIGDNINGTDKDVNHSENMQKDIDSDRMLEGINARNSDDIMRETECNDMTSNGDMIKSNVGIEKLVNETAENASENFDLSKVKSERIEEDEAFGASTENDDYNLDADTEPEDADTNSHSMEDGSENVNEEGIKPEFDPDTQVIVLNKHNKFNARKKPDPSCLRHECDKCDDAFRFPHQLAQHKRTKHEGKYPYYCKICDKPFERSSSLRDHMYVHTDSRPYECKLCSKSFKMKGNLRKHIRDMHDGDEGPKLKFQCEYCSKIFPTKQRLTSHFLVHDSAKPFECNVCGKRFNRKNNLKEHIVIHSTEKNFVCPDCGMRFNRKYSLKIHARNHMAVKPYKCELCPASFSQLHALKTHFRLHTGEKPFKCTVCEKTFRQLATLQVHLVRHSGVKDFKCGVCGRAFVIKRRLIEHERCHTGEKPFSCDLCPYLSATSSGLRLHKKTHMRQMARLAMLKSGELVDESFDKTKSKKRLPPLTISTKFLEKKSTRNENMVADVTAEVKEYNAESVEVKEAEPVGKDEISLEEEGNMNIPGVTEPFSSESLIEIVNDIEDAELYATASGADIENSVAGAEIETVNEKTENSINNVNAEPVREVVMSDPQVQVGEVQTKGNSAKKRNRAATKKTETSEQDFDNSTKEVLYKHLNEFIPTIDADILTEKIELITKELFEIHGKSAPQKINQTSAKKSKKKQGSENANRKRPVQENMNGESYVDSMCVKNSAGTMYLQNSNTYPYADLAGMSTFATQTMLDEGPTKKRVKHANPPKPTLSNSNTPAGDKTTGIIRQLLSTTTPQNTRQAITLPSATAMKDGGNSMYSTFGVQNVREKNTDNLFFSSALRNMLVTNKPAVMPEQMVSMATPAASVKKEPPSLTTPEPAGSSTVLRNMLSTPPKHYLVSTKNSYAAMLRSLKRQNEVTPSQNGFQGMWHTTENTGGGSDFPWVDEKDPEPLPNIDLGANIKVEPISP